MSVIVALFPKDDTEVKVRPTTGDRGKRGVVFWTDTTASIQFHDVSDALAWLAKVTADLYVAAYPDEVTA